jgi:hypothetical protein
MRFKVPKDVDIEDRIVGPLTIKQLGWLGGGVGISLIFWKTVDTQLFVFLALIIMGLAAAFAFVKPYNQSLIAFCGSVLMFLSKPKQYFWRRIGLNFPRSKSNRKGPDNLLPLIKKGFSEKEVQNVVNTLDSEGNS